MNNLNKITNYKIYFLFGILISLAFLIIILLFNITLQRSMEAILEVDDKKNFIVSVPSSNIQQINETKTISLRIEKEIYLLENVQFFSLGNNRYAIKFDNQELLDKLKSQSFYNVKIFLGDVKLFKFIFNLS